MSYMAAKHIHLLLVVLTLLSFTLRFYWSIVDSALLQKKVTKILPHIIDSGLLVFGFYLIYLTSLNPFQVPWLGVKLLCLIGYIVLGTFAIKRCKTKKGKIISGSCAIGLFFYMFATARFHEPIWFL